MRHYVHGLRVAITQNGAAYGFSLVSTASFGVLSSSHGAPDVGSVFAFLLGAAVGFVALEAIATNGFRDRTREPPPDVIVLGSALGFASMGAAVGAAALAGVLVGGWPAWPAGGFAATTGYVLVVAVEMALAERIRHRD